MASFETGKPQFADVRTKDDLAMWLEIPVKDLTGLAFSPRMRSYTSFSIPKKDGGVRTIFAPNLYLKKVQHKLAVEFENIYKPLPCVHGFVEGRSIVSNARAHTSRYALLCLDITDFFPSLTANRVHGLFQHEPFCLPEEVVNILTELVTYKKALPQGAPSSPVLSNMICWRMDKQLMDYAKRHGLYYTRYADDITFSCINRRRFGRVVCELDNNRLEIDEELVRIIHKNGFVLNERKTHVALKTARQSVTGVIVNKKCNMPRDDYRELRVVLHKWEKEGVEAAAVRYASSISDPSALFDEDGKVSPERFKAHIRGRLDFYDMVCSGSSHASIPMRRLWSKYHALVPDEKVPALMPVDAVFQTEYIDTSAGSNIDKNSWYIGTAFLTKDLRLYSCDHCLPSDDKEVKPDLKRKSGEVVCKLDQNRFERDKDLDIAFLNIKHGEVGNSGLPIDRSYRPQVGERVIAYGFAEDQNELSRIEAIVMNVSRGGSCLVDRAFIKGMSGGPVFDTRGDVIGLVTKGSDPDNYVYNGRFQLIRRK